MPLDFVAVKFCGVGLLYLNLAFKRLSERDKSIPGCRLILLTAEAVTVGTACLFWDFPWWFVSSVVMGCLGFTAHILLACVIRRAFCLPALGVLSLLQGQGHFLRWVCYCFSIEGARWQQESLLKVQPSSSPGFTSSVCLWNLSGSHFRAGRVWV